MYEGQQKTFADKLRERQLYQQGVLDRGATDFATGLKNDIPLDPQKLGSIYNSLLASSVEQLQPYEQNYQAATDNLAKARVDNTEVENLMNVLKLNQEDRRIAIDENKSTGSQYVVKDPATGQNVITDDPMKAVMMSGGSWLLDTESSLTGKQAKAEAIMALGGVDAYLKSAGANDIFTTKEKESRDAALNIKRIAGDIVGAMPEGENAPGVGPLGQFNLIPSDKGRKLRADMGEITAEKMRQISGAAISEQEAQRLQQFLPNKGQLESNSRANAQRLYNGISIGLDAGELAKRNNMSLEEAYIAFADELYSRYGEEVPTWIKNDRRYAGSKTQVEPTVGPSPTPNNNSVMMVSPDGQTYEVDAGEVSEAEKNGWKRK
jgi:hypothetical protein